MFDTVRRLIKRKIRGFFYCSLFCMLDSLRYYDYESEENMKIYGQPQPPEYDLGKVTAPVSLHYSLQDSFVNAEVSWAFTSIYFEQFQSTSNDFTINNVKLKSAVVAKMTIWKFQCWDYLHKSRSVSSML